MKPKHGFLRVNNLIHKMLQADDDFVEKLKAHAAQYQPVIHFQGNKNVLAHLDLSEGNVDFKKVDVSDLDEFESYISSELRKKNATFGYGGYNELRPMYGRSDLFNSNLSDNDNIAGEPRRLHIGLDIWGEAGTPLFSPLDATIHSFAYNDTSGDYGATIILFHQINDLSFYTLYGHLSLKDIEKIGEGSAIEAGQKFAHFGLPSENGNWPPHLHFQIIKDIGSFKGDYPGVCKFSEQKFYLENSPDPNILLQLS